MATDLPRSNAELSEIKRGNSRAILHGRIGMWATRIEKSNAKKQKGQIGKRRVYKTFARDDRRRIELLMPRRNGRELQFSKSAS